MTKNLWGQRRELTSSQRANAQAGAIYDGRQNGVRAETGYMHGAAAGTRSQE